VAGKLNTSECVLLDNYTRHRELWDTSIEKATKDTAEILKSMAGTSELFANNGKLIRVAAAAAEQNDELLFVRVDGKQTLLDFVKDVYLPSRIDVTVEYTKILYSTVSRFNAFFGKAVSLDELNEPGLCSYLKALRRCVSARTVNNHRQRILTFWKAAYDQGIAERPPRLALVRRLPEEVDPPEAWTIDECSRIFSTASQWPGMVGDIPAGEWWLSLLLSIYWTSCRIGAIMSTPASAYKGGGILVRKQKNHRPQWYALPASCCKAINKTAPENRKFLWPWPQHPRTLWTVFRLIIQQAGVAQPPGGRQLFHRLRRTSLSLCAAVDPAIAQRQAGHADYSTTLKHYIDPKMARGRSAADVLPEPIITTSTERGVA
jgi:integrase